MDGLQKALIEEALMQDKAHEIMDKSWSFPYFSQIDKGLFESPHSLILRFKSLILKIRHCYQIKFNKFVHFKIMFWPFLIFNHVFKSTNHNMLWY